MSKLAQIVFFAMCTTVLLASTAQADRRTALRGNLLIDDQDDLFVFPNQIVRYSNMITLDYGSDPGRGDSPNGFRGSGLFTMGNDRMAFGVALRRGDALTPHGAPGNALNVSGLQLDALDPLQSVFSSAEFQPGIDQAPVTVLDVIYGNGDVLSAWGFRLSLGYGSSVTSDMDGDETGEENLYLMGEFGYGVGERGKETRTDISVSALIDLAKSVDTGSNLASGFGFGLDGLVRMYFPVASDVDLGVLGNLGVATTSVEDQTVDEAPSASRFSFGLGGGAGPAMQFGNASVAAYGTLRFAYQSFDPSSEEEDDADSTFGLVVPGLLASFEVPLTDWFMVRSGAQYDFLRTGSSEEGDDTGSAASVGSFGWNVGLGVLFDDFRFDGTVQQGFVTNGPNFVGGNDPGFLAIASLTYVFDKQRDGMHRPKVAHAGEDASAQEAGPAVVSPAPVAPRPPVEPVPPGAPAAPPPPQPVAPPPVAPAGGSPAGAIDTGASGGVQASDGASAAGGATVGGGISSD
ncbi:MAG: hypothetical protein OXU20_13145 [Myxococcales bacterium]|nr:hypothetical protein [Myxococcales bacterium]